MRGHGLGHVRCLPDGAGSVKHGRCGGDPAPVASATMFSWVMGRVRWRRRTSPTRWPSRITITRSQMPTTSGSSLEITSTATPRARELVDEPVDLAPWRRCRRRASARRGCSTRGAGLEQAREQHLLLVAARERADVDRAADARGCDSCADRRACARAGARPSAPPAVASRGHDHHVDVVAHREVQEQALRPCGPR